MTTKNSIIFGDSYSTYMGCIPTGYATFYAPIPGDDTYLESADLTWWGLLMAETNGNLVRNDSWSGSTIGFTSYNGMDTSRNSCFLYRLEMLEKNGFFRDNTIDQVFVFGGTNDSWSDAPLGVEMYKDWVWEDFYEVLPAIGYFFLKLRSILPNAEIYGLCNCGIKPEIVRAIENACAAVGGHAVVLEDIDKASGHPTRLGMEQIKDQILTVMNAEK